MRIFSDQDGTEWQVWQVTPTVRVYQERRRAERRSDGQDDAPGTEFRFHDDRRRGDIQHGWLCFDSGAERRRLYPVPGSWEECSEDQLRLLLRAGVLVARRPAGMDD